MQSWLGLGSNLNQPLARIQEALTRLRDAGGIEVLRRSSFYRTPPWGDQQQAEFINAVVHIETSLDPLPLLRVLQSIEHAMGRKRSTRRWGPRQIDIDLLLYGDRVCRSAELELPHPRMHQRAFVLAPICELDKRLEIPGHGPAGILLDQLDCSGISLADCGGADPWRLVSGIDAGD